MRSKRSMGGTTVRHLRNALCGALIGAGAVLPGVSGGVLAVAFGVYQPLMEVLAHPRTAFPRRRGLLLPLGLGWCVGFAGFAKGLAAAIDLSPAAAAWLFIGLIAGTVPALFREAGREGRGPASWTALIVCALGTFAGLFVVGRALRYQAEPNAFWCAVCGILWGASVAVPGLTSAPILMALGLYRPLLEGLTRPDPGMLAACLTGMVLSVLLLARTMDRLLRRRWSVVAHGILGIVAASTAAIVPVRYAGTEEAVLSAVCCAAGTVLAASLERLDRRLRSDPQDTDPRDTDPQDTDARDTDPRDTRDTDARNDARDTDARKGEGSHG